MANPYKELGDMVAFRLNDGNVAEHIWWINCGEAFDANNCIPVPAGSFVRRAASTPHYDGVISGEKEPAIVAICGLAPVDARLVDPSQPGWRKV